MCIEKILKGSTENKKKLSIYLMIILQLNLRLDMHYFKEKE